MNQSNVIELDFDKTVVIAIRQLPGGALRIRRMKDRKPARRRKELAVVLPMRRRA